MVLCLGVSLKTYNIIKYITLPGHSLNKNVPKRCTKTGGTVLARTQAHLLITGKQTFIYKFDVVKLVKVKHNKQMTSTFRLRLASS